MAVKKTSKEENIETQEIDLEKDELIKKNQEQNEEINKLKKENEDTTETLKMLQKQMQEMQSAFIQMKATTPVQNVAENKSFEVGCRLISGMTIYSPNREVERALLYGNENITDITKNEIELLLRNPQNRKFFELGVIYFVDKDSYNDFKIYNYLDLDDEGLIELLTKNSADKVLSKLTEITKNKREDALVHSIFYRIVDLNTKNKLVNMPYEVRKTVEKFFNFKIDVAMMLLDNIKSVKL